MLIPHLLKIYFGPGWPSSILEIVSVMKIIIHTKILFCIGYCHLSWRDTWTYAYNPFKILPACWTTVHVNIKMVIMDTKGRGVQILLPRYSILEVCDRWLPWVLWGWLGANNNVVALILNNNVVLTLDWEHIVAQGTNIYSHRLL